MYSSIKLKNVKTFELFPKIGKPNKNGMYINEEDFHKCMGDFIKIISDGTIPQYVHLNDDNDNYLPYFNVNMDNVVGSIKNIVFDNIKQCYLVDVFVFSTTILNILNINFFIDSFHLAAKTYGNCRDNINYPKEIAKLVLYPKSEIEIPVPTIDYYFAHKTHYDSCIIKS